MERHVQSILLAAITMFIGFLAKAGWEMSHAAVIQQEQTSTLNESVRELKEQVRQLNGKFDSVMPRAEIEQRFSAVHEKTADHARRIEALEAARRRP